MKRKYLSGSLITLLISVEAMALPGQSFIQDSYKKKKSTAILCSKETQLTGILNKIRHFAVFDCGVNKTDKDFCKCVNKIKIDKRERDNALKMIDQGVRANMAKRLNYNRNLLQTRMRELSMLNEMNAGLKEPLDSCLNTDKGKYNTQYTQRLIAENKALHAIHNQNNDKSERSLIQYLGQRIFSDLKDKSQKEVEETIDFTSRFGYLINHYGPAAREARDNPKFQSTLLNRTRMAKHLSQQRKDEIQNILSNSYYPDIIIQTISNLNRENGLKNLTLKELENELDKEARAHVLSKCNEFSELALMPVTAQEFDEDAFSDTELFNENFEQGFYKNDDIIITDMLNKKIISNDRSFADELNYNHDKSNYDDFGYFDETEIGTISNIKQAFYRDMYYCHKRQQYTEFDEGSIKVPEGKKEEFQSAMKNYFVIKQQFQADEKKVLDLTVEIEKINELVSKGHPNSKELLAKKALLDREFYDASMRMSSTKASMKRNFDIMAKIIGENKARYVLALYTETDSTIDKNYSDYLNNNEGGTDLADKQLHNEANDIGKAAESEFFRTLDKETQIAIMEQRGMALHHMNASKEKVAEDSKNSYVNKIINKNNSIGGGPASPPPTAETSKGLLATAKEKAQALFAGNESQSSNTQITAETTANKGKQLNSDSYKNLRESFMGSAQVQNTQANQFNSNSFIRAEAKVSKSLNKDIKTAEQAKVVSHELKTKQGNYTTLLDKLNQDTEESIAENKALESEISALKKQLLEEPISNNVVNTQSEKSDNYDSSGPGRSIASIAPSPLSQVRQPQRVVQQRPQQTQVAQSASNAGLSRIRTAPSSQTGRKAMTKTNSKQSPASKQAYVKTNGSAVQKVQEISLALQEGALVLSIEEFNQISTGDLKAKNPTKKYPDHIIVESAEGKIMVKPVYKEGKLVEFEVEQRVDFEEYNEGIAQLKEEIDNANERLARYAQLVGSVQ